MGTDIHSVIEVYDRVFYDRDDIKDWQCAGAVRSNRYYSAWYAMAGVQYSTDTSISEGQPRGLPDDASSVSSIYLADDTCLSWMTLGEMKRHTHHHLFSEYIKHMEEVKPDGATDEDVRLVFGFVY